jgi:heterodisulfide reductase subunit D
MQAMMNIQVLNGYEVKKIVTACPHCFNTLKNEYPELGGDYEVVHHTQLIQDLIQIQESFKSKDGGVFKGKKITFHDPCYLGRANDVYDAPRELIEKLDAELVEMKRCKTKGLCCGAGGAQMFKEAEKGDKEINVERTEDALETKSQIIATGCPFCNTMMTDGVKNFNKENESKSIGCRRDDCAMLQIYKSRICSSSCINAYQDHGISEKNGERNPFRK